MAILPVILFIAMLLVLIPQISSLTDAITQSQPLPDGSTLVSEDGSFELGFFSPGSSTNRYVGIWYKNIPVRTVIWVANRDNPIKDNSSMLNISREGNLVLLSHNNKIHWSTNTTTKALNAKAQLLTSGNLVITEEKDNNNPQNFLWQSFDYPTDTLLPGMKLGWNLKTGLNRRLIAWKNWDDPSSGEFTWEFVRSKIPDMVMWNGSKEIYRSGPYNGIRYGATPSLTHRPTFSIDYVSNNEELYYSYGVKNSSVIARTVMNQTSWKRQRFTWDKQAQKWKLYTAVPRDFCDTYNRCGPFGNCAADSVCRCLNGFKPKSQVASQGCVRSESWSCKDKNKDGFIKLSNMKTPDTKQSWVNQNMSLEECKVKCWENCSCTAFANSEIDGDGSGCVIWFGDLVDLRELPGAGQDLYIRSDTAEIANQNAKHGHRKEVIVVASTVSTVIASLLILTFIYWRSRTKLRETTLTKQKNDQQDEDLELPFFDIDTITHATDDFSIDNKLGEGGFGPVYKGTLPDGQEIAVKRLSSRSGQGLKEFKNEVIFCAQLQHRNLVKVLGYCIQEEEKLLIYEYMPNKSLDFYLFDLAQSKLLDWSMRYNIIGGIARGLLYLHQDSRLRIIHRDLKASNILLDKEMNPKISDFGLARMCGSDQIEGNTSRVVGTFGYMAPEYATDGLFSIKSDVFSFGILLLEIVSGKRNKGISYTSHSYNLISHAWQLWKEGIPMELIDACLMDICIVSEAIRCIHVGLLCVQHHPNDRPSMTAVVLMLSGESNLPQPKEPGFLIDNITSEGESLSMNQTSSSTNDVTISILDPR